MSDTDARNWLSCLGWGCLVVVVIAALGIGGCVTYLYKGGSAAHAVAEAYLAAVDAGRFEEAFETLGPDFTEERGLAEFVAFEQSTRVEFGACGDWRLRGTSFNRESGVSESRLTFLGSCEERTVTAAFRLEKLDGTWVVQDIRYNEPIETAVTRCADCGDVVPPGARYCPACGAPVGAATDASGQAATPIGDAE